MRRHINRSPDTTSSRSDFLRKGIQCPCIFRFIFFSDFYEFWSDRFSIEMVAIITVDIIDHGPRNGEACGCIHATLPLYQFCKIETLRSIVDTGGHLAGIYFSIFLISYLNIVSKWFTREKESFVSCNSQVDGWWIIARNDFYFLTVFRACRVRYR